MDSNGTFYGLAGSANLPDDYTGGDPDRLYIVHIGSNPTLGSLTFETVTLNVPSDYEMPADLTFNLSNGKLYGSIDYKLYEFDPVSGDVREVTVNPKDAGDADDKLGQNAGGAWSTSNGDIYFYDNADGNLTKVEILPDGTATVDFMGAVDVNNMFDATACRPPYITITKKASKYSVAPGEEFVYTFSIYNPYVNPIDVNFTDILPSELTYVSGTLTPNPPSGGTVTSDTDTNLTIENISLSASGMVEFNVTVKLDDNTATDTNVSNVAYISYGTITQGSDDPTTSDIDDNTTITTVVPPNHAPVVDSEIEDQSSEDNDTVNLDVSSNFKDEDGDTLTYSANGLPAGLSIDSSTGKITGTIDKSASQGGTNSDGVYSVTVTAKDSDGKEVSDTFTWTVTNPTPTAANDSGSTKEDTTLSVSAVDGVLGNDSDPDGDTLSVTTFTDGTTKKSAGKTLELKEGNLTINSDGSYTFVPASNYSGSVPSITYTVEDKDGASATAKLDITV